MATRPINQSGIVNPANIAGATGAKKATDADKSAGSKAQAKQAGDFDVNISTAAKERADATAKALDIARNTPDVREDRVAEIKAQIAAGSYKIDSGKIADGMLREAIKDHLATIDD